ncbi:MAG TPA: LacI family DNA-binding transcriptional regulator [Bacilli bacterium]|nr:LacI family DNA-binding transcriptional regulator [Bacilli bacterium]
MCKSNTEIAYYEQMHKECIIRTVMKMKKAIRIIDIANELGMSRNTVAKALNGNRVPDQTRQSVFEKAAELGYKGLGSSQLETTYLRNQKILILTSHPLSNLSFFMALIRGIESTVRTYNFELLQYTFNENTTYRELNAYIKGLNLDGIICIESFSERFIKQILSLEIPIVFIDFMYQEKTMPGYYDIVTMSGFRQVKEICDYLINKYNFTTFGFVGDYRHCLGFYERFAAMREALFNAKIDYEPRYSLLMQDTFEYGEAIKLKEKILDMNQLPQAFICANDFIASSMIKALTMVGKLIPRHISVIGFDNSVESRVVSPKITTVHVDKEFLGKQALLVLLNRIKHPKEKNRIVYIDTEIIIRESTPS